MYLHEIIRTPDRHYVCLSIVYTWDNHWESAYSVFDKDAMIDFWGDNSFTAQDIRDFGECAGAFDTWTVVRGHCAKPETAERALRAYIAKYFAKKT